MDCKEVFAYCLLGQANIIVSKLRFSTTDHVFEITGDEVAESSDTDYGDIASGASQHAGVVLNRSATETMAKRLPLHYVYVAIIILSRWNYALQM